MTASRRPKDEATVGEPVTGTTNRSVEEPSFGSAEVERELTPSVAPGPPARISSVDPVVTVPALWLDRMFSLLSELPFHGGRDALVRALTAGLEDAIPDVRVGVAFRPRAEATAAEARHVLWTEPPKSDERLVSPRLFPELAQERAVPLPLPPSEAGAHADVALHFASDDDVFRTDVSPHVQAMDRAAILTVQALCRADAEVRRAGLEKALRTAEAQMVQAEKLASLGQIAAGMVHELNNPLTSIAAYTDFLLRRNTAREGADADDVERLRRIAESASRMLRFTRDLVSYARPAGDVPVPVQLNAVVDRALAFCEHELVDVGAVVHRHFDADLDLVRGQPEQLAQVFVNLVTNACHAMARSTEGKEAPTSGPELDAAGGVPRSAVLTVTTSRAPGPGGGVAVVVQDSGCGITVKHLAQVFDPFFTTKAAGRGTGLGLSIVKNIVEAHGGAIRAESDTATGTRFILTFPRGERQGEGAR